MWNNECEEAYTILLLIEHERSNGSTGIGTITSLTTDMNSGMANAKLVGGTGNSARRRRHYMMVV